MLTSLVIKEMQMKIIMRYYLTPAVCLFSIWQEIMSVIEDVEERELSYIAGGDLNWHTMENGMEVSKKIKNRAAMWPSNSSGYITSKSNNIFS